jgi:HAMP domain-containing protein
MTARSQEPPDDEISRLKKSIEELREYVDACVAHLAERLEALERTKGRR